MPVHHFLGMSACHRSLMWTFLSYNCGTVLLKSLSLSHSVFKQGRALVADIVLLTDYLVRHSDKIALLSQLVVIPKVFLPFGTIAVCRFQLRFGFRALTNPSSLGTFHDCSWWAPPTFKTLYILRY